MTIKLAVTNLGKYNEGALVYEWITLPATEEELAGTLERIGINAEYEEYFISDYEAPFPIGEYTSFEKLNVFAEEVEHNETWDVLATDNFDAHDVINAAQEFGHESLVENLVSSEDIDEMLAYEVETRGWQGIRFFLGGIQMMNEDFYAIDGCGNMRDLRPDEIEDIAREIIGEVAAEYGL